MFWDVTPPSWVILSRRFEATCVETSGTSYPLRQSPIPEKWICKFIRHCEACLRGFKCDARANTGIEL